MKRYLVLKSPSECKKTYAKILSKLKIDDVFYASDLADRNSDLSKYNQARRAIHHALQCGVIQDTTPTEFVDFCNQETVAYFARQLKQTQSKNTDNPMEGTRGTYLRLLFKFDQWLKGREFTFKQINQVDLDTFKVVQKSVTLDGIEHFLQVFASSKDSEVHFVKMIKSYLMDDIHQGKKYRTMESVRYSILGYFEKNDYPIKFKFDASTEHEKSESQSMLNLKDVFALVTKGNPSIMERAIVLCKFHRGLDNSTFADGFNFESWKQICKHFGTDQYQKWDMSLCPVPITLTRVKNQYSHTGFLDVDAIESLQAWLKKRYEITGKVMDDKQPLFFTKTKTPINGRFVYALVSRLAKKSGIQEKVGGYSKSVRYEKNSHELRDLLKSMVIDASGRLDIADHIIGHKPKDSYEKQNELFPETLRDCFSKCRQKLNIFSNVENYVQHGESKQVQQLQQEIEQMKTSHKEEIKDIREMILQNGMKKQLELDSDMEQIVPKVIQKADVNLHIQYIQNFIANNKINDDILSRGDDTMKEHALQNRERYNKAIQTLTEDMIKLSAA